MNAAQKILIIIGAFFAAIGGTIVLIMGSMARLTGMPFMAFVAIPLLFVALGAGFIIAVLISYSRKRKIRTNGIRYEAKIYGYVENTSYTVNGRYPVNTKVRYFDTDQVEREAVIPTGFARGSGEYPIGMTITIYEYQGKFNFDPASVRDEVIPGEAELMDDKPLEPEKLKMVAVTCKNCGASYQAATGYSSRCPYCGGYQNV